MTSLRDFVDKLIQHASEANASLKATPLNFSLYCDGYPISQGNKRYVARVVYCVLEHDSQATHIIPPQLRELSLEYVVLRENCHRSIGTRIKPFEVCGNTTEKTYKGSTYYEYSLHVLSARNLAVFDQLCSMYDIKPTEVFRGKHHDIVLPEPLQLSKMEDSESDSDKDESRSA